MHRKKPVRCRLKIGTEDPIFNYEVQANAMFVRGRPVVQIIYFGTYFTAVALHRTHSINEVWNMVQNLWILTYFDAPDIVSFYLETRYISEALKENFEAHAIYIYINQMIKAPIESPGYIQIVEEYHAHLYTKG